MSNITPLSHEFNVQSNSTGTFISKNLFNNTKSTSITEDSELTKNDNEARKAANQFEALLIHTMLKSMRKTTMAEDKSNARGIYDDMLDKNIAHVMMESGGLGVSDQIFSQIREENVPKNQSNITGIEHDRLRALLDKHDSLNTPETFNAIEKTHNRGLSSTTQANDLSLANSLWGNIKNSELTAQQKEFLEPLIPHATRNAKKLGTSPAAILAIAALETGWGRSTIKHQNGQESYNYFGIKASDTDNQYTTILTTEYLGGTPQKLEADFKIFDSPAEAVDGFTTFIKTNPRYSKTLTNAGNPEQFLRELQAAGYATDPRYANKVISIMRQISGDLLPL